MSTGAAAQSQKQELAALANPSSLGDLRLRMGAVTALLAVAEQVEEYEEEPLRVDGGSEHDGSRTPRRKGRRHFASDAARRQRAPSSAAIDTF